MLAAIIGALIGVSVFNTVFLYIHRRRINELNVELDIHRVTLFTVGTNTQAIQLSLVLHKKAIDELKTSTKRN